MPPSILSPYSSTSYILNQSTFAEVSSGGIVLKTEGRGSLKLCLPGGYRCSGLDVRMLCNATPHRQTGNAWAYRGEKVPCFLRMAMSEEE